LTKSFLKKIFSLFLRLLVLKAGAKVQPFFYSTKTFLKKFFSLFLNLAPFLKAGAKVQHFFELTKCF